MELLTNSRAKTFRRCQRRHHFSYTLGRRPAGSTLALTFGTAVHKALELRWQGKWKEAVESLLTSGLDVYEQARARAMLFGYQAFWHLDLEVYQVIGAESQFRLPLGGGWFSAGKLDVLLRDGEETWLMEHKTSSEDLAPGSTYWSRLRMDTQVTTYLDAVEEAEGVLYDVLGKPALRPGKANKTRKADETPEEFQDRCFEVITKEPKVFYAREKITRTAAERSEHQAETALLIDQIEAASGGQGLRNPDACFDWHRACEYLPVCAGGADIEDDALYQITPKHPELEETTDADE